MCWSDWCLLPPIYLVLSTRYLGSARWLLLPVVLLLPLLMILPADQRWSTIHITISTICPHPEGGPWNVQLFIRFSCFSYSYLHLCFSLIWCCRDRNKSVSTALKYSRNQIKSFSTAWHPLASLGTFAEGVRRINILFSDSDLHPSWPRCDLQPRREGVQAKSCHNHRHCS